MSTTFEVLSFLEHYSINHITRSLNRFSGMVLRIIFDELQFWNWSFECRYSHWQRQRQHVGQYRHHWMLMTELNIVISWLMGPLRLSGTLQTAEDPLDCWGPSDGWGPLCVAQPAQPIATPLPKRIKKIWIWRIVDSNGVLETNFKKTDDRCVISCEAGAIVVGGGSWPTARLQLSHEEQTNVAFVVTCKQDYIFLLFVRTNEVRTGTRTSRFEILAD